MKYITIPFALISFLILTACSEDVTFANDPAEARECPTTNDLVGQTRTLRISDVYEISGNVTIVSDCEVQITNFNYSGEGPNVSFYGANNNDFRNGINLSEELNGTVWDNETLNLFLPEGETFDDINSFSVWCFEFDVNFSSASF